MLPIWRNEVAPYSCQPAVSCTPSPNELLRTATVKGAGRLTIVREASQPHSSRLERIVPRRRRLVCVCTESLCRRIKFHNRSAQRPIGVIMDCHILGCDNALFFTISHLSRLRWQRTTSSCGVVGWSLAGGCCLSASSVVVRRRGVAHARAVVAPLQGHCDTAGEYFALENWVVTWCVWHPFRSLRQRVLSGPGKRRVRKVQAVLYNGGMHTLFLLLCDPKHVLW